MPWVYILYKNSPVVHATVIVDTKGNIKVPIDACMVSHHVITFCQFSSISCHPENLAFELENFFALIITFFQLYEMEMRYDYHVYGY
jgi:hypothetical protein